MKKSLLHTISILPRKLVAVLLVLFAVNCSLLTVNCYGQWFKQPIPVNQNVYGIKFIDTLNGWACTAKFNATQQDTAFIIHTTNGGANWFIQYYKPTIQGFSAITMVNNMVGYAAGDSMQGQFGGGSILIKTTNGGLNWFNIPIAYNMSITKFYFISPDTGWETDNAASSPDARLTTDGGYTWLQRTNGMTDYSTVGVNFINFDTGFCASGYSLYKTTNSGINWNLLNDFGSGIGSIFFLNEQIGWVDIADFIKYTSNGGISWVTQIPPPTSQIYSIFFFDNSKGYASDIGNQRILKTTNGGTNWGYQIDTGSSKYLSFADSLHGWSSPFYNIGAVDHTTNGGGSISYVGIINISDEIPEQYRLFQNYPNPFNPSTKIRFSLIKASYVQIKIFDVSGRELNPWIFGWYPETLLQAGTHEFQFDGSEMASGVYFFKLIVTDGAKTTNKIYESTIKMILVK